MTYFTGTKNDEYEIKDKEDDDVTHRKLQVSVGLQAYFQLFPSCLCRPIWSPLRI